MRQEDVKIINYFVAGLSEKEAREQLSLAFQMMERCLEVLNGNNKIKPVSMKDNGLSTDLELFYKCKQIARVKR